LYEWGVFEVHRRQLGVLWSLHPARWTFVRLL
jgi:hypothetical protein